MKRFAAIFAGLALAGMAGAEAVPFEKAELGASEVTLYLQPQTATVMPSGALQKGKRYTFVGQLHSSGQFTTDQGVMQGNVQLWGFSYDVLD